MLCNVGLLRTHHLSLGRLLHRHINLFGDAMLWRSGLESEALEWDYKKEVKAIYHLLGVHHAAGEVLLSCLRHKVQL